MFKELFGIGGVLKIQSDSVKDFVSEIKETVPVSSVQDLFQLSKLLFQFVTDINENVTEARKENM